MVVAAPKMPPLHLGLNKMGEPEHLMPGHNAPVIVRGEPRALTRAYLHDLARKAHAQGWDVSVLDPVPSGPEFNGLGWETGITYANSPYAAAIGAQQIRDAHRMRQCRYSLRFTITTPPLLAIVCGLDTLKPHDKDPRDAKSPADAAHENLLSALTTIARSPTIGRVRLIVEHGRTAPAHYGPLGSYSALTITRQVPRKTAVTWLPRSLGQITELTA